MNLVLAVDFGGTKTGVGIFDFDGNEVAYHSTFNPKTMDAEEVWDSVAETIEKVFLPYEQDVVICSFAAAGPMDANKELITPPNTLAWVNFPLKERVEKLTGKPVIIEGDAKALALGEGFIGAAKGYASYMSMVVSTGIGGGIVVDGRLLHGKTNNAGEIGHMIIDPEGPHCGFGCYGCIESIASGPSLERKFGFSPKTPTLEMIHYCADNVAQLITNVVTMVDLEIITVGGSVALGFGDEFFSRCQNRFNELSKVPFISDVLIVPSALGKHGGVISAARVGIIAYESMMQ